MPWQKGPLPKDTWNWGGVVPQGDDPRRGFEFADFCGDHVLIHKDTRNARRLEPHEVKWFNNALDMPPGD